MASRTSHIREFKAIADAHGYRFEGKTRRGHVKWRSRATGYLVITGSDLSDRITHKNAVMQLRKGMRPRGDNR